MVATATKPRTPRGTKPATTGTTRRGRVPGTPNRSTVVRRELEAELGRKLNPSEVAALKKDIDGFAAKMRADNVALTEKTFADTGLADEGLHPAAVAAVAQEGNSELVTNEAPEVEAVRDKITTDSLGNALVDASLRREAEASVALDGETQSIEGPVEVVDPTLVGREPAELTLIRIDDNGILTIESPTAVLVLDDRESTPSAHKIGDYLDYLAEFKRTPLVEQTIKELYSELGARIGV